MLPEARNFFHDHRVREVAQAQTADVRAGGDTEHAQLAELLPQRRGEGVFAVGSFGQRGDFAAGEVGNSVAQAVEVGAKVKVHRGHAGSRLLVRVGAAGSWNRCGLRVRGQVSGASECGEHPMVPQRDCRWLLHFGG